MTVSSPEPTPEPTRETSSEGGAAGPAAGEAAGRGEPMSRGQWVAALCGALALAVMAGVLFLAKRDGDAAAADGATSDGARHRDRTPSDVLTNIDRYGRPRQPLADFSGCGQLDPDKPPAIEFELEDDLVDLGRLKQGVKINREIVFRSTGEGALCIAKVSTGCGCLEARLEGEKKRFEPGESGKILVAIDTTGRVGRLRKDVTLVTNALDAPRKSFRVEMDIAAGLIADPRYVAFGTVAPNTPETRTLFLRAPKEDGDWEVTGVEGARSLPGRGLTKYTYEVEPADDAAHRRYKLEITHPGLERIGQTRDIIRIHTTHPDRKQVDVTALINVRPRIMSRTQLISLGFVRPGTPRPPMTSRIQPGVAGVSFSITGVRVVPPEGRDAPAGGVGFLADFGQDALGWWVSAAYDGKSRAPGLLEALLVVETDDEVQPEVRVPLRATIRAPKPAPRK